MHTLQDKIVVITGGANGIGASIVKEFLKEGVGFVVFLDIDEVSGQSLEQDMISKYGNGKTHFVKCDVTKDEDLFAVFTNVMKKHGGIDVVVNNAGLAFESLETYKSTIAVNFTAVITSTLKALALMRTDKGGRGGTIINISSVTALSKEIVPLFVYSTTKSAILNFSNHIGMKKYYDRTGVRVLTICFGATDTNLFASCKSFDKFVNEEIILNQTKYQNNKLIQSTEEAAKGLVQSYKHGQSGSTWLVENTKIVDISDKIAQANAILSSLTELS